MQEPSNTPPIIVWFRRDLRDHDHAALAAALAENGPVFCVFVFDSLILDALPKTDRRISFIYQSLVELDAALRARGGALIVRHGDPVVEIPRLASMVGASAVFAHRDYEPYAKQRDAAVAHALAAEGRHFSSFCDQVIFEGAQLRTQSGRPYTVFTPYRNAWIKRANAADFAPHASSGGALTAPPEILASPLPSLESLGFVPVPIHAQPGMSGVQALFSAFRNKIDHYHEQRDFPSVAACSNLSPHLRFGTLSIRTATGFAWQAYQQGSEGAFCWLSELVWRDFYFTILDAFPHVTHASFKPEYDRIVWDEWPEGLAAWKAGMTGYPLVDAAMRQLAETGTMHNRLRMLPQ